MTTPPDAVERLSLTVVTGIASQLLYNNTKYAVTYTMQIKEHVSAPGGGGDGVGIITRKQPQLS